MTKIEVRHSTTYRYARPVSIGPHRLMTRPRDSHAQRLLSAELICAPAATLVWSHDVFGNSVAEATFGAPADTLTITSRILVEQFAPDYPVFGIAGYAHAYPFSYTPSEIIDLGALTAPQYLDADERLKDWARKFILSDPTDTLALLKDINNSIPDWVSYQSRDEEGTQGPLHTLARGWGTCRDFAVLFVEAVRSLGFGARIVSGYLSDTKTIGAGSTHAWAEVYLPGAGWIAFDPTNRALGGANLIAVAVARNIEQTSPISGSYVGTAADYLGMDVNVTVTPVEARQPGFLAPR